MYATINAFECKVRTLLQHLHDSYKGYSESAEDIESTNLKLFFSNSSEKRKAMIAELELFLAENNIDFSHHGSMEGAIHRMFVNLKSIVTGKDEKAILTEVEQGESFLADEYKDCIEVLRATTPGYDQSLRLLQGQLAEVEANLAMIKSLNT